MAEKSNKLGGESVKEELGAGIAIKAMTSYLNSIEDKEAVQQMLRNLPSWAELLLDPAVRHTAFAILPDFGRPELARALKDVIEAGAHNLEDMAHDAKKKGLTPEVYEKFEQGTKTALKREYAVIGRLFHTLECGELPALRAQQQKGRDGDKRPQAPQAPYRTLALAQAIQQRYFPCQFCISGVKEMKLPGEAATQRKLEPLEIIGSCKDENVKTGFIAWLKPLTADEKKRVWEAFKFLSSEREFVGLMTVVSSLEPADQAGFIDKLEGLLQGDEVKRVETQNLFGSIGGILQGGTNVALELVSDVWNATGESGKKPETQTDEPSEQSPWRTFFGRFWPKKRKRIGIVKAFTL